MKISSRLQKEIMDFLKSIPTMHDSESQRAFIYQMGLDQELQDQIPFGKPLAQFVPLVISILLTYGKLNDGREVLEVLLETTKDYIGEDRKAYCDELIKKLRANLSEEYNIPEPSNLVLKKKSSSNNMNGVIYKSRDSTLKKTSGRYKVIAFDFDGTLMQGTRFSWSAVWRYLGFPQHLQKLGMRRYLAGETSYKEWCEWACNLFIEKGLKKEDFKTITQELKLVNKLFETLKILKQEGFVLGIISGGIDIFIETMIPNVYDWFDYIFANKLIFDNYGRLTGVKTTDYDFEGKFDALQLMCEENGCTVEQSVFVGDSFNDNYIIRNAGLTIAFLPESQEAREIADQVINENDFTLILPYVLRR